MYRHKYMMLTVSLLSLFSVWQLNYFEDNFPLGNEEQAIAEVSFQSEDAPTNAKAMLLLAGDFLPGVTGTNEHWYDRIYRAEDPGHRLKGLQSLLSAVDLAMLNFEGTYTSSSWPQNKQYVFKASPERVEELSSFNVIGLANNHAWDYGEEGLLQTLKTIEASGRTPFGAGIDDRNARAPAFSIINDIKIGFLGYTDVVFGRTRGKGACISSLKEGDIKREVADTKAVCDYLVVSVHWGAELASMPTERQKKMARLMVDSGADAVVGHHPHVPQPIEVYREKPIFYSLGEVAFYRRNRKQLLALITVTKDDEVVDASWEAIPITIVNGRPVLQKLR